MLTVACPACVTLRPLMRWVIISFIEIRINNDRRSPDALSAAFMFVLWRGGSGAAEGGVQPFHREVRELRQRAFTAMLKRADALHLQFWNQFTLRVAIRVCCR